MFEYKDLSSELKDDLVQKFGEEYDNVQIENIYNNFVECNFLGLEGESAVNALIDGAFIGEFNSIEEAGKEVLIRQGVMDKLLSIQKELTDFLEDSCYTGIVDFSIDTRSVLLYDRCPPICVKNGHYYATDIEKLKKL